MTPASTSWPPTSSGRALYAPIFDDPIQPPNHARFLFLDRRAGDFWRDWGQAADDAVALLRASAGRDPYDRQLSDLIGELSTRSDDFRVRWATHDVRAHITGAKRIHHPEVGDLDLPFESTPLPADPGQHLVIYSPEPDTPSHTALQILASWAARPHQAPDSDQRASRPRRWSLPRGRVTLEVEARAEVADAYRRQLDAMVTGDVDILNGLLADDYTARHITGYEQPKAEWLAQIRDGHFVYHRIDQQCLDIRVDGDAATLTSRDIMSVT